MAKKKHVLSVSEKETLKQEANELRAGLREMDAEQFGAGTKHTVDKAKLRRQAEHLEAAIKEGEAGSLRGAAKDKVYKHSKELAEKIKEGMLSTKEMTNPGNALHHLQWEKKNAKAIHEWKQAQRRLEPNDPGASNIERLRRRDG